MKMKLCYLFLGFSLMASPAVAQESIKPYIIKNMEAQIISVKTSTAQLPNLSVGESTSPLVKEDFPLYVLSGDPKFSTPEQGLKIEEPNSYMIIGGQPEVDRSGNELPRKLNAYPMATPQQPHH